MSDGTHIEWTATVHPDGTISPGATWNPIRARRKDGQPNKGGGGWHCERVSPGCQHCYAERLNGKRFGTGLPYNRKSRDLVDIYLDEKALTQPLHWRRPRKIFVCSMTDLFGEWVPDEMIDRVFAVMALSPQHTFQVLTKRPERMREYLSGPRWQAVNGAIWARSGYETPGALEPLEGTWPLPNCWLGVSAEDQEQADKRIPELLATPAAVRFVSAEPLLGPVDFSPWLMRVATSGPGWRMSGGTALAIADVVLDWVIAGGESGPGARPFGIEWARSVVRQCQAAGVAVFVKQLGARPYSETRRVVTGSVYPSARAARTYGEEPVILDLRDRKGGGIAEWPEDLRMREFPR